MKRIALLLAAVGLGSGCVVNTCDTGTLTVDWSFVGHNGNSGLSCSATGPSGLSVAVGYVDVYVDGARVVAAEPCSSYGVSISSLSSGAHDVIVEGYDTNNQYIVTRDWFTVSVAACGDSFFAATPGEGIIDFQVDSCEPFTTYLLYELKDVTRAPPSPISAITPTAGPITKFPCVNGIYFPVPWGYYDLTRIEETDSTAAATYASKCSVTQADILNSGTTTTNVLWTSTGAAAVACFP
jgi:hypothetical protein